MGFVDVLLEHINKVWNSPVKHVHPIVKIVFMPTKQLHVKSAPKP